VCQWRDELLQCKSIFSIVPWVEILLRAILISLLILIGQTATTAELSNSGSQIQQIPLIPSPRVVVPDFHIENPNKPFLPTSDQPRILVKNLRIKESQQYSESELLTASGFLSDSELTLNDLRTLPARIANYYHQNGYFLAQAYLPAQDVVV
jgi:hemolysin activation/secretion protein